MAEVIGGATYVFDARVEGARKNMALLKADFRATQKEADRIGKNGQAAMRAFGSSIKELSGASGDPAKIAKNWARATGQLASDMDKFSDAARRQGVTFAELTQRLIYFKDQQRQATRGRGELYAVMKKYDLEAATQLRLSSSQAQSEAILTAAIARTKDQTAKAAIMAAAYGNDMKKAAADADLLSGRIGLVGKAMAGFVAVAAARSAATAIMGAVKAVGDIGDLAANIGMTTDEVQELQYAFAAAGISAEDSASGLQRFADKLSDARRGEGELAELLTANNIALTDREGNLRSSRDIIGDFADMVRNAATAEDALNMSVMLFGRVAGRQFTEALREGRDGLNEMAVAAAESGSIISAEQIKAADEIEEKYNLLFLRLQQGWRSLVVSAAESAAATLTIHQQMLDDLMKGDFGSFLFGRSGALRDGTNALGITTPNAPVSSGGKGNRVYPATKILGGGKGSLPDNIDLSKDGLVKGENSDTSSKVERASAAIDSYIASLNAEVAALKLEIDTLGLSNAAKARAAALAGLDADATDEQRSAAIAAADAIAAQTNALDYQRNAQEMLAEETRMATEAAEEQVEAQREAADFLRGELQGSFYDLIDGTKNVGDAFVNMGKRMVDAMLDAVIFGNGPFAKMLNMDGGGNLFSGIFGSIFKSAIAPSQAAAGGSKSGWTMVGEEGPEMVKLPRGSSVTPAEHMSRALKEIMGSAQRPAMAPALAAGNDNAAGGAISVAYAPNVTINGDTNGANITRILDRQRQQLNRELPAMIRDARRRAKI